MVISDTEENKVGKGMGIGGDGSKLMPFSLLRKALLISEQLNREQDEGRKQCRYNNFLV